MKKGLEYMIMLPVVIIITLIVVGLIAWFSGTTLFGAFKAEEKFVGENCPGKTQRDFQKEVIGAIKDKDYDMAVQKHDEFTYCFPGKDLKFSEEQMYDFGVAAKELGSMEVAEYLLDRYREEHSDGVYIAEVEGLLEEIYS